MHKLALVGGAEIAKYSVAGTMWPMLSNVSGIPFSFEIIPLVNLADVKKFYEQFTYDKAFVGFNVALPWKADFAKLVDYIPAANKSGLINTVFKRGTQIIGDNTDPLGIMRGFKEHAPSQSIGNILVLGAGGGGYATARHLSGNLSAKVFIYDISYRQADRNDTDMVWLPSLQSLASNTYDLIINATPLGKQYLDQVIPAFSSPLDLVLLQKISHPATIVQEMNYLPLDTLLLQMGELLGLTCISGEKMLVYQATESLQRYFGVKLSQSQMASVIAGMRNHIFGQEASILGQRNDSATSDPT